MKDLNNLDSFDFKGKKVLLRVDLNVPIIHGKISDTSRIERIIPTIEYLIKQQAKIILISHFGRPKGKFVLEMSLAPIVDALNAFLPQESQARFSTDCIGEQTQTDVENLNNGDILLLENLRFYPGEKDNDIEFTKELASLGDIYINDSFACSHRSHASIVGLAELLPCGIGLLFQEEIDHISKILKSPKPPFAAIIGGSKISTKLELLHSLIKKTDMIIIGGGMANTFLKSQGHEIGTSICEYNLLDEANVILESAQDHNCKIVLPEDVVIADNLNSTNHCDIVDIAEMVTDKMILDLGPATCTNITKELEIYNTVVWNGPLGACEYRPFNIATELVARSVASYTKKGNLISIAGGGDIIAALKASGLKHSFTYLSTAGGAFLEWLEGKIIPGIQALKNNSISITKDSQFDNESSVA